MNWMVFAIVFGLFVVVPIVAILSEGKRKTTKSKSDIKVDVELMTRLKELESTVAKQQIQIEDLKELVHVNILKMEDATTLQQRIDL